MRAPPYVWQAALLGSLNREMSDQEIAMLFGGMGCGPGCAC